MNKKKLLKNLKIRSNYKRILFDSPLMDLKKSLEDIKNGRIKPIEKSIIFKDLHKKKKPLSVEQQIKRGLKELKQGKAIRFTRKNFMKKSNKNKNSVVKSFKQGIKDLKNGKYEHARNSILFEDSKE